MNAFEARRAMCVLTQLESRNVLRVLDGKPIPYKHMNVYKVNRNDCDSQSSFITTQTKSAQSYISVTVRQCV